jgi:hypothetical protein
MFSRTIAKLVSVESASALSKFLGGRPPVTQEFADTLENRQLYGDRFIDDMMRERAAGKNRSEAHPT